MRALLLVAGLLLVVGACGPQEAPEIEPGAPAPSPTAPDEVDPDVNGTVDVPEDLERWVEAARDDLAVETDVPAEAITIVAAEHVTWPDGSIGCPEPGGMYTQALVDGYRIVLDADGEEHHYHGAEGQPPFRCPAERRQSPTDGAS